MYEKTNKAGLMRDTSTGAILNCDLTSLEAYKKKKQKAREVDEMKNRQESLETEVSEIKDMLQVILQKLDN